MKPYLFRLILIIPLSLVFNPSYAKDANTGAARILVRMTTSKGNIDLELDAASAPVTVRNFLSYADKGKYDGTIFHRVISGFMIQGGGYDKKLQQRTEHKPIRNEADNGLKNTAGTIAMARTGEPHSASNQFFINTVDNAFLDHQDKTPRGWGYTVFGHVTSGMAVVKAIESTATRSYGPFQNLPVKPVTILKIRQLSASGHKR